MTSAISHVTGSLRVENGRGTVRMEDVYDTTVVDLWSALTEPDRLARWIAEVTGELRLGGLFQARFTSSWEGPGRVDVCDAPRRLMATMSPGADDETVIEATLADDNGRTRLVIEERGLPLDEYADHGAGWRAHIEDLTAYLDGRDASVWHDRWMELIPRYRELAQMPG
ncbi:SRPBCC family protein [Rathayibacter soli]|uniref:SRPBCC family protein n=1 Tax=Rathayibacter soli TaxID=3144168 RepID=UPI0027E48F5C|nr:SRPBCC family protein [Glaciibacter superstes]